MEIFAEKRSWSTSAKVAAKQAKKVLSKKEEELVTTMYPEFLERLNKLKTQGLPPRRMYVFIVELMPGAKPQVIRFIPS